MRSQSCSDKVYDSLNSPHRSRSAVQDAEIMEQVAVTVSMLECMFQLRKGGVLHEFPEVLRPRQACECIRVWLRGWNYTILVQMARDPWSRERVKAQKAVAQKEVTKSLFFRKIRVLLPFIRRPWLVHVLPRLASERLFFEKFTHCFHAEGLG